MVYNRQREVISMLTKSDATITKRNVSVNNQFLYKMSIVFLKQFLKEDLITEQEFIGTEKELQKVYKVRTTIDGELIFDN